MGESIKSSHWPVHLRPGAVRFTRSSGHYDRTVAFYRDLVGLPVVGEFAASFGEDGMIFGLPDTAVQLEIVRGREPSQPNPFDQLVLYVDDPAAVEEATAPLRAAGLEPNPEPHAYWRANGAVIYRDPDGREVVFAPWVYGRDVDPVDRASAGAEASALRLDWFDGDRDVLRPLFREAEDSGEQLNAYIRDGRVLVAWRGTQPLGHLQLVPAGPGAVEVKNMAVLAAFRGSGIGRALLEAALTSAAADGVAQMFVATAAADVGNLRFYQRCGFRLASIDRDAFTADTGYADQVVIDGIPLRDRVWLERPVDGHEHRPHR